MTRAERRAILGAEVIAHIDSLVDAAPEPTPEVVETLRRIFTNPLGPKCVPSEQPADAA